MINLYGLDISYLNSDFKNLLQISITANNDIVTCYLLKNYYFDILNENILDQNTLFSAIIYNNNVEIINLLIQYAKTNNFDLKLLINVKINTFDAPILYCALENHEYFKILFVLEETDINVEINNITIIYNLLEYENTNIDIWKIVLVDERLKINLLFNISKYDNILYYIFKNCRYDMLEILVQNEKFLNNKFLKNNLSNYIKYIKKNYNNIEMLTFLEKFC